MTVLTQQLIRLESSGLISLAQAFPELEYFFRHALVQDAAYKSLLIADRRELHQRVAESLERLYPNRLNELAPLLGHHFAQAEESKKAIFYFQKAGEQAVNSYANEEAITYFNNTLVLLESLPSSREHAQQELTLQITLGRLMFAVKGFGSPEGKRAFDRALALAQQVGEPRQGFAALHGLWGYHTARAQLQTARKEAEQLLSLAQQSQNITLLLWGHFGMGLNLFWLGEILAAQEHYKELVKLYDPKRHGPQFRRVTEDPGVNGLCHLAMNFWLRGYPDQSLEKHQEGLSLAQGESHPYTLAFTFVITAWLYQLRREKQLTQQYAEIAIAISTEQRFPLLLGWGTMLRGWALATQEQTAE